MSESIRNTFGLMSIIPKVIAVIRWEIDSIRLARQVAARRRKIFSMVRAHHIKFLFYSVTRCGYEKVFRNAYFVTRRMMTEPRRWIFLLMPITASLTMNNAAALSVDRKVVLFADEYTKPLSTAINESGDIFVTLFRLNATVIKLSKEGEVLWSFEEHQRNGIREDFQAAVPLSDGGVIVCVSRISLPGRPLKQYPGALIKIGADGKEVNRFDPLNLPEEQWTFGSGAACVKWGADILFIADPLAKSLPARLTVNGKVVAPNVAIRLRADLSIVWTRIAPIYQPGPILGSRPTARELDDGKILLNGIDRSVILDASGGVLHADTFNYCLLLSAEKSNSATQRLCRERPFGSPWQLFTIDNQLRTGQATVLGKPADDYEIYAAASLPGGLIAFGGADEQHRGDFAVFDAKGNHVATHHFSDVISFIRSQDRVRDVFPLTSHRILVVTESYSTDVGNSILTWFRF